MPSFETYQSEVLPPGWLKDPVGQAWLRAFGSTKDAYVAAAKEAVKARYPRSSPLDALASTALERGIDRGVTEPEVSFRRRVYAAWDVWRWAGTPYGLLLAFWWAGYTPSSGRVLLQVQAGKQYRLRDDFDPAVHDASNAIVYTDLGAVHLGGSPELWNQFAVLFVDPLPTAWSPTPPADASSEIESVRSLIVRWKPGHAKCVALRASGGRLWGYPSDDLWNTYNPQTWAQAGAGISATYTPPAG